MDRRVIRSRIAKLRRQIAQMAPARDVKRGARRRFGLPTVAVVGYTNAGKSSLTNRLTGSAELVENALFATLDTAVRRAKAKDGRLYAYVDTVGFVRRLPTQLIEALIHVGGGRRRGFDRARGRWMTSGSVLTDRRGQ